MFKLSSIICYAFLFAPAAAWAHREDYLNKTFVYQTVEPGALEFEYWAKYGSAQTSPARLVEWEQTGAAEFGITDHWMVEGSTTIRRLPGGQFHYLTTRVESRFRLFEEGEKAIDPAFSVEYSHISQDGESEQKIEPTFVLSKDFYRLNVTMDFSLAKSISTDQAVETGYAVASRYDFQHFLRVGFEAQGEFSREAPAYIIPQVHLLLPHDVTAKLGTGLRYAGEGEHFFVKFVTEIGFDLLRKERNERE